MKILLVKMSSLGDIIHTFPAVSDAAVHMPQLEVDWVVEESFAEMPTWHPNVRRVIPIGLRRWRKQVGKTLLSGEVQAFLKDLRAETYDYILDAQGLLKSAIPAWLARGLTRCGFDRGSAREGVASFFYQKRCVVDPHQSVVTALRLLFAQALNYPMPNSEADFGIEAGCIQRVGSVPCDLNGKYWIFLHGTSHINKEWPVTEWIKLAGFARDQGYKVYLPWGNSVEHKRALAIAAAYDHVEVLPRLNFSQIAQLLACAKGVIGLDTGFSHLAAALRVPTLSIYRASNPHRVCITGVRQQFVEVRHQPTCRNAMPSVGIYEACGCFENLEAEHVMSKFNILKAL